MGSVNLSLANSFGKNRPRPAADNGAGGEERGGENYEPEIEF